MEPVRFRDDRPKRPFCNRVATHGDGRQHEDLFLDCWREQRQADDLRDPRPRQPERPRCVSKIVEFAGTNAAIDLVGE
jgi:hypothetical protein